MTDFSSYQFLEVSIDDGVATITLNRPKLRNAAHDPMHQELETIFSDVGAIDSVRAIVLTGAGEAFCAGGDASSMDSGEFMPSGPRIPFNGVRRLVNHMLDVEQPIIGAINGDAAGLGATLALMCDITFVAETARIGDTHVKMGLVAGDGGAIIWPALIGMARAKQYLFTGDWISGSEAERIGLVNFALPTPEVLPKANAFARRMADGAPMAIRWTKYSMNKLLREQVNLALDTSMFLEAATMGTEDLKEAASAFLDKRPARFQGR
ncbi:MAG: enoyl-CoA hydratase-related protein [Pseudomonadales bacterium]|jgi:enoyl-CoA hydratase|nr:enoyl-CoA hydratase-related protein [Pseudomonadales bacterium]MDP6470300.1 enoyl-CoA hydratase-related protein [Pseudomonadales bacterium]MDP6827206.1 enoyl-CoA hydratase-related protein [Pseudomonadales bacterium]MDP6972492.1 enoyl-CoA hydratase-related protein [Pseudomonadales bacterium]|tara:strand:+ start:3432 stop:4229 length:798 start_codon:yes stop_codon:yes gene_type:complete